MTDHTIWMAALLAVELAAQVATVAHLLLSRRDVPSTVGWAGLVILAPMAGLVLYWLFGINRITRKAHRLRPQTSEASDRAELAGERRAHRLLQSEYPDLVRLGHLGDALTGLPLEAGNRIEALIDGDQAYPRMLEAIDRAEETVGLSTYIFDTDAVGLLFADALERAHRRGVSVRILVDGVGQRYSHPPMPMLLRRRGIPTAVFLASVLPVRSQYLNLRNHRKILVVDGRIGFTGGLNIRAGCQMASCPRHPIQDLHLCVEGPVVRFLVEAFALDWTFTTGERLGGDAWFPVLSTVGQTLARGVPDGPDEDFDIIRRMILGALTTARARVRIVSPYFLPDQTLTTALNVTALRGVEVEILMPEKNNLKLVQWAAQAQVDQLLEGHCRIRLSPPPFDHTKLMLIDDAWSFLGSANWDVRSLRLNFEYNLECYDRDLSRRLHHLVDAKTAASRELTLGELADRSIPVKLRDGFARLFSPYL
ncbi:phospholipase D-like domain-containing protein [Thiocapsa rosea]|uniref:Cardiolipin synthetase 2 n=1 Tax=Thiocapsa rosea TaxID=69360 RepID=A0A495V904_9GAMM|nr:phospholipase D-like domain-containing protein [Thiocapsa rosea]RKT45774.1 cardiolipin synthetase 2 [Thiocapsa rosea]